MKKITTALIASTAACVATQIQAKSVDREYTLDIKRGLISSVMADLSKQTGLRIECLPEIATEGTSIGPIKGSYTAQAAISTLLVRSDIAYERRNECTFVTNNTSRRLQVRGSSVLEPGAKDGTIFSLDGFAEETPGVEVDRKQVTVGVNSSDQLGRRKLPTIEEVVVTAQKREERLIDVPMTINVLSSEELEQKGIADMKDLAYAAPGVFVQEFGPGRQVIFMRGVANLVGEDALTSVYLDEVPASAGANHPINIGQLDLRTTDLQRVEVLKGPQGTVYGAGAVGGNVRFITADPKLDQFGGKGELIASFTEDGAPSQGATAVINTPVVTDALGLRLAAAFENNGGWIDRPSIGRSDVNENKLINVRLKSLWRVSDDLDIRAMAIVHRNHDADSGGINHSDADGNFTLPVDPNRRSPFDDDYEVYNLTATYNFRNASLVASSSYVDQDANYLYTIIPGPETKFETVDSLFTVEQRKRRFSQEIRLTSSGKQAFKWTVGAFYLDADTHAKNLNETIVPVASLYLRIPSDDQASSVSWAAFADGAYAITDKLEVGAGARYFEDEKSSKNLLIPSLDQNATFDKVTWRVNARYSVTDKLNVYANIATGFRSGGFNGFIDGVPNPPFKPETLLSYEIGSKLLFQEGRGHLDVAVFYSNYKDYLRRGFIIDSLGVIVGGTTSNFGDARIKGVDLSASVAATQNLVLYLNGAYTDAEITSINSPDPNDNLTRPGDPVDYVPKVSYSVGGEYRFSWGDNLPGFAQVDYNYRDKVSVIDRSITLIPTMYSDDIRLLNARFGVTMNRWSVQMFGENLTNENGSFDPWVAFGQAVRNRPRTFGLRVGVDFD